MEGMIYHPLFDFDSIVDLPLSVAKLIREEYYSEKYFINLEDEHFLKCLFATIPTRDPMRYIMTDKYVDRCDELYNELMRDPKLVQYYSLYDVANLINIFTVSGFTKCTVLVKDKQEQSFIKDLYKNEVDILVSDKPIDINNKYGMYYTSNIYNLIDKFIEPKFINFRILDLKCNMESKTGFETFKFDVLKTISSTNNLNVINSYNDLKLPEEV